MHVAALVQTNQCPYCCSLIPSKSSAVQHVQSFAWNRCLTDHAIRAAPLQDVQDIECPKCALPFDNLMSYNWHIRTHIAPSYFEVREKFLCTNPPPGFATRHVVPISRSRPQSAKTCVLFNKGTEPSQPVQTFLLRPFDPSSQPQIASSRSHRRRSPSREGSSSS